MKCAYLYLIDFIVTIERTAMAIATGPWCLRRVKCPFCHFGRAQFYKWYIVSRGPYCRNGAQELQVIPLTWINRIPYQQWRLKVAIHLRKPSAEGLSSHPPPPQVLPHTWRLGSARCTCFQQWEMGGKLLPDSGLCPQEEEEDRASEIQQPKPSLTDIICWVRVGRTWYTLNGWLARWNCPVQLTFL